MPKKMVSSASLFENAILEKKRARKSFANKAKNTMKKMDVGLSLSQIFVITNKM